MKNNKNVSSVLKSLGACYTIDHVAICDVLRAEAPELLEIYNENNPIGKFVFFGDDGVHFIPTPKNPTVFIQMADRAFQRQVTMMLDIVLRKVPEYMIAAGLERQSYERNMAKMSEVLFTLLIDIESLKANHAQSIETSSALHAHKAINEAARFIGILSDEYGIQGQAVAFNDESAIKLEVVSRDEVGLGATQSNNYIKTIETIH